MVPCSIDLRTGGPEVRGFPDPAPGLDRRRFAPPQISHRRLGEGQTKECRAIGLRQHQAAYLASGKGYNGPACGGLRQNRCADDKAKEKKEKSIWLLRHRELQKQFLDQQRIRIGAALTFASESRRKQPLL
jgi:hypothetical protein